MTGFKCIACGEIYKLEEDAKSCPTMNDEFEEDELETIEKINDLRDWK